MDLSIVPGINIILAPMYAGKTTEILRRLMIYHEMGMKVLYINSGKDTRSGDVFSSHNCTIGNIPFDAIKLERLANLSEQAEFQHDVIAVDEAGLFPDLKEHVMKWVEVYDKIVIVAGLNGDFKRDPFGQVNELIPLCDSIIKLTPFCINCKKNYGIVKAGLFTRRIVQSDETILIGGKDSYIPVCRDCYLDYDTTKYVILSSASTDLIFDPIHHNKFTLRLKHEDEIQSYYIRYLKQMCLRDCPEHIIDETKKMSLNVSYEMSKSLKHLYPNLMVVTEFQHCAPNGTYYTWMVFKKLNKSVNPRLSDSDEDKSESDDNIEGTSDDESTSELEQLEQLEQEHDPEPTPSAGEKDVAGLDNIDKTNV
jgi:thymidine kinase